MLKNEEIHIRDPFVLVHGGKYYLYGTRGETCWGEADGFDCYVGEDLNYWSEPVEVFHRPEGFWSDRHYWAPEVYFYRGAFYMAASFKAEGVCRGTQILKADSPLGPFVPNSDGPVTPRDWECLDGTLYIGKENKPYLVFCHEWLQIHDGEICVVELSEDLTKAVGEVRILFRASEAGAWIRSVGEDAQSGEKNFVTDGPYPYRLADGTLLLLWSSFGENGYTEAIARSDNGEITGNWIHEKNLLFERDGGHGMIFQDLEKNLWLLLHSPNQEGMERPKFYPIKEIDGSLAAE